MTLFNISNRKRFYTYLDACEGGLTVGLPGGQDFDWKSEREQAISRIGEYMDEKPLNIRVTLQNKMDSVMLVKYMAESVAC
ncbi:hypothetical protein LJC56_00730 [Christensenellaceae bacterium OttesenSCG-928-K19]|nr:hypothetical protein [Christensenellaceae bacterium OttesenSCG-928-K19]